MILSEKALACIKQILDERKRNAANVTGMERAEEKTIKS